MAGRRKIIYMAVQVVSREEDGTLKEWWDGEPRSSAREAKADAVRLYKENPGCRYTALEKTFREVGEEKFKPKEAEG